MTDALAEDMVAKNEQQLEQKDLPAAEVTATELAEVDPNEAIAWFVKGKTLYLEEKFEDALACLSKAAELEKERPEVWHVMGYCLIALGRFQEAADALDYVKSVQGGNAEAIAALGVASFLSGNESGARENFRAAFKANRPNALMVVDQFYNKFVSVSPGVASGTKAYLERVIETERNRFE